MKKCLLILFAVTLFISCKKSSPSYWFTGMQIIDTNYNLVKWVGQKDDDWQINKYTLAEQQLYAMAIDSFSDTAFWNHTSAGTVTIHPGISPVAYDTGSVYYQFNSINFGCSCYFSLMVVDQYFNTLVKQNYNISSGSYLPALVSIPSSKILPGQVYRIYYACSATGNPYFATGWGDFGVCSMVTTTGQVSSCF